MEGACFELKWMLQALGEQGVNFNEVVVTGGASRSDIWNQIHSDIYNLPVKVPEIIESSLMGAAMLAGLGSGLFKDIKDAAKNMVLYRRIYHPNQKNQDVYQEQFIKFKTIIEKTYEGKIHDLLDGGNNG